MQRPETHKGQLLFLAVGNDCVALQQLSASIPDLYLRRGQMKSSIFSVSVEQASVVPADHNLVASSKGAVPVIAAPLDLARVPGLVMEWLTPF